jgi:hypothetical protein
MKRNGDIRPAPKHLLRKIALLLAVGFAIFETMAKAESASQPTEIQQKFGLASLLSDAAPSLAGRVHSRSEAAKPIDTGSGYPYYSAPPNAANEAYWRPGYAYAQPTGAAQPVVAPVAPSVAVAVRTVANITAPVAQAPATVSPASVALASAGSLPISNDDHIKVSLAEATAPVPVPPTSEGQTTGQALAREVDQMEQDYAKQQALASLQPALGTSHPTAVGVPVKLSASDRLLASLQLPRQESKFGEQARQQAQSAADYVALHTDHPSDGQPMYVAASRGEVDTSDQIAQAFRSRSREVAPALPIYAVYDSSSGGGSGGGSQGQAHAAPSGNSEDDAPGGVQHLTSTRTTASAPSGSTSTFSNSPKSK